ncbi:MAG TPA: hypothetical protein VFE23_01515 [Usitatibacter sp.]|jgi:hypothetical protein|nr:hypothetical protein [Usitatibacter sp.]
MSISSAHTSRSAEAGNLLARIDALTGSSADAFLALHDDTDRLVAGVEQPLFASELVWTDAELQAARWIHEVESAMGRAGLRLARSGEIGRPPRARSASIVALAMHYAGEAMKWATAVGARSAAPCATLNQAMSAAIGLGIAREPLELTIARQARRCSVESLYVRTLLLCRFAGGNITCRQLEILDALMWSWLPILHTVPGPAGQTLHVDVESSDGLRLGMADPDGRCMHLDRDALERAYDATLAEFQAGNIVPEGLTASFPMSDHIAALDVMRRGLRRWMQVPVARAPRLQVAGKDVELFRGLAAVAAAIARPRAPMLTIDVGDAPPALSGTRPHRDLVDAVYETPRHIVQLRDLSSSGIGVSVSAPALAGLTLNEIVALRLRDEGPLVLGKIARVLPAQDGRRVVGIRRLGGRAVLMKMDRIDGASAETWHLVHVPGAEASGRDDAYLVTESQLRSGATLRTEVGQRSYDLCLDRVRDRGPGWVLAGFGIRAVAARAKECA